MQRYELEVWLGPALDRLTEEHIGRLMREAERIDARYPDPDEEPERQAALAGAVQYLLGETSPQLAGLRLAAARSALAEAMAVSQQIAAMAADDGMTEKAAATATQVTRMTVRKARGK